MKLRVGLLLLLAAPVAGAEEEVANPFALPPPEAFSNTVPGARARYAESLARLRAALARHPADPAALERLAELLEPLDRTADVIPLARKALEQPALDAQTTAALQSLLGHLLWLDVREDSSFRVVIVGGGVVRVQQRGRADRSGRLVEAMQLLRRALASRPEDARAAEDLAAVLEETGNEKEKQEAAELRRRAAAVRLRRARPRPERVDLHSEAERLLRQAAELEQRERGPRHSEALQLRKRALVLAFCDGTIPFAYDEALYRPASLLAPADLVNAHLTRTYRNAKGQVDSVPPQYFEPSTEERLEIVHGLGADHSDGAAALLLAVLLHASGPRDPVARGALEALAGGGHAAAREQLPRLLGCALFDEKGGDTPAAQRFLVELAARWKLKAAAPVLATWLCRDRDLLVPRDLPRALGAVAGTEAAGPLLELASDPDADLYFRRQAVRMLGRVAPDRLGELPDEPALELARAAAGYATAPSAELRGLLISGIGREHETDEAARYCAELGIREALPRLQEFLATRGDHYARPAVEEAIRRLEGSS